MVHEMIDGTYRHTNLPNESPEYLAKREELRLAEIELLKQRERVATLRRGLPKGAKIQDYEFLEGPQSLDAGDAPARNVRLSDLFIVPDRSLVIYHFMYGKKQTNPCPMCTAWIDSFNGVAHHLAQNVDLAIVATVDPSTLRAHARNRGWDKLPLLSAGDSTFKYDLGSEDGEGHQDSTISVFTRDSDGTLRHFYSGHPRLAEDIKERGIRAGAPRERHARTGLTCQQRKMARGCRLKRSAPTKEGKTMTQAPNKFIWYELMTTDQDVAETFYRAVVGWNMAGIPPSISSKGLRASLTCGATDHR